MDARHGTPTRVARQYAALIAMEPMSQDLLIEIGCEDLPARHVRPLAECLAQAVAEGLSARGVAVGATRALATPRRLAVLVAEVAAEQPAQERSRKGPSLKAAFDDAGQPTKAAEGFARSCGVTVDALLREDDYLVYRATEPGRSTAELLPEVFEEALRAMDALVPRRMRWDASGESFVRPVRWLCALHGETVAPLAAFGLQAGRETYGHRFHAPAAIALARAGDYVAALEGASVVADMDARRDTVRSQVEAAAKAAGGSARITEDLLEEVTALIEWPVAVTGRIEAEYMALPPEVIVTTVETNQRYFTVFDGNGALLPVFITVANIASSDPQQVVDGNERVVRPRLADALFFWEQDRRQPLADFLPKLAQATFQKDLGSIRDKAARVTELARQLAAPMGADPGTCARAAELCKADLATQMVFEFTELQGVMGGYYARASGEDEAVAAAIAEHYAPTGAGAPIPATAAGRVVALADKLDSLAGIFAAGQPPTASKDPFALRRAAIGALRILLDGGLRLNLRAWLDTAISAQPVRCDAAQVGEQLWQFVSERLRGLLAERGISREVFDAVAAMGISDPVDFAARAEAVVAFSSLPEAEQLAAAHKRARNILRQAGDEVPAKEPESARFVEPAEGALAEALARQSAEHETALAAGEYTQALRALAPLQTPVDAFFDAVMVNADDAALRANRLALLAALDRSCRRVADLSQLSV